MPGILNLRGSALTLNCCNFREWQKGLPHGKGKIWYDPAVDDTDYYEGSWANGVQNGFGVRQYPNGDR